MEAFTDGDVDGSADWRGAGDEVVPRYAVDCDACQLEGQVHPARNGQRDSIGADVGDGPE